MSYPEILHDVIERLAEYRTLWIATSITSVVLFVGTLIAVPIVCVRLPSDYFVRPREPGSMRTATLRTIAACILILAGIAMLVLPGQGLLTILIGVSLLDFPCKRRWQRRLLTRPAVLRALNGIRSRAGKDPFRM